MADQALLNLVVIDESTAAQAGGAGGGPWSYRPGHTPEEAKRFADLSDAFKRHMAGEVKMSRQEQVEFFRLEQKLPDAAPAFSNYANFYANAVSPAAPASATFRTPSPAQPGWNVPNSRPQATIKDGWDNSLNAPGGPRNQAYEAAVGPDGKFDLQKFVDQNASQWGAGGPSAPAPGTYGFASDRPPPPPGAAPALPPIPLAGDRADPYGVRGAPAAGPNPWAKGLAGAAGADADARAAERDNRKAAARDQRKANRNAFAAATANLSPGKQALLGGLVGGAKASRAGGSFFAGAGKGAMAAAGGPVGIAMAVAEFKDSLKESAVGGIKALGDTAKSVAGNDYMGLFQGAVGKAAGAIEKLPIAGEAIALPFKLAGATIGAFNEAATAFVARGKELSPYSSSLAAAESRAEVSTFRSDVREAKQLEESLAALTDAMTRQEAFLREALLPIKAFIVDVLTGVAILGEETMRSLLQFIAEFKFTPEGVKEYVKDLLKALNGGQGGDLMQEWVEKAQQLRPDQSVPRAAAPLPNMTLPIFTR